MLYNINTTIQSVLLSHSSVAESLKGVWEILGSNPEKKLIVIPWVIKHMF